MRLNHNMQSLNVFKNYKQHIDKNSIALERVSTGSKINSAKDNPIKLAQSENIRMRIRGLQSAQRNAQDGISMLQTADSAMGTVSDALIRMKELSVQAANDTFNEEDKATIQNEIDQLKGFIDQTAETTEFNGNKLLANDEVVNNNYPTYKKTQVGSDVGESISIAMFNMKPEVLGIEYIDVSNTKSASEALNSIDKALVTVNAARSKYGSIQQRMETTADNLMQNSLTLEKADGNLRDADLALEMAEFSRTSILKDASTAIMTQTNNFPKEILGILERIK